MKKKKTGVWVFGAKGGLATTMMVGARAIAGRLTSSTGLVTDREELRAMGLVEIEDLVFGGHDIRSISLYDSAYEIYRETGSINFEILHKLEAEVRLMEEEIRPGACINSGAAVEKIADRDYALQGSSLRDVVRQIRNDIKAFREKHALKRIVAINLASTEPLLDMVPGHENLEKLELLLDENQGNRVRASMLYAYA
ncbi:MAG: inositol-3-phosphate synthase, partial [Planctomycetota bacterium]